MQKEEKQTFFLGIVVCWFMGFVIINSANQNTSPGDSVVDIAITILVCLLVFTIIIAIIQKKIKGER